MRCAASPPVAASRELFWPCLLKSLVAAPSFGHQAGGVVANPLGPASGATHRHSLIARIASTGSFVMDFPTDLLKLEEIGALLRKARLLLAALHAPRERSRQPAFRCPKRSDTASSADFPAPERDRSRHPVRRGCASEGRRDQLGHVKDPGRIVRRQIEHFHPTSALAQV
jgi:hypothetical protein